ncbi:class I SAM-dependent methyltransferase [Domibacillus robiginosus]|uniref:class I SAM-dependent methyltransferase n=1 Tax=Domibacillus robiginosus TaxID=1071054 RepID=UPI00067D07FB|nr:class I SAM-dependent methyltransferase [Domibacillus robiginosus]
MKKHYLDFLAEFGIGGAHPGGFSLTKEIFSAIDLPAGASFLEIGCGTGQTAEYVAETFGCTVTAIDNHSIMLEKAKERLKQKNVTVLYGNAEQLAFRDQTFDFVLAESVLSFTSSVDQALCEASRVLKKGGACIAVEMTAEKSLSQEQEKEIRHLYGVSAVLTEEQWREKWKRAGFSTLSLLNISPSSNTDVFTELRPSKTIREELFDLWDAHDTFMSQPDRPVGYRIFYGRT